MDKTQALLTAGYRYAYALTHAHRDAEDLVHDAWLCSQHRWTSPTKSYLFQAIRHRWADRHRKKSEEPWLAPVDDIPLEEGDVEGTIARVDLERALAQLKPREREMLFLATIEQWSAREIAAHVDAPRGTVLSILHRAKAKLARTLRQKGHEDAYAKAR